MTKLEGFKFRLRRAIANGVTTEIPVPYDDMMYRQRCISWGNAFEVAINNREFRRQWLDFEYTVSDGYCLDAQMDGEG